MPRSRCSTARTATTSRSSLTGALAVRALLSLTAMVGFGLRYRARGDDLDRWLASARRSRSSPSCTTSSRRCSRATTSRRATSCASSRTACFSSACGARSATPSSAGPSPRSARASRARSTTGSRSTCSRSRRTPRMLESGADLEKTLPQLKEAAAAAQQEARFAVLALSSAGGSAPFDAALRRYVEFLTADGRARRRPRDRATGSGSRPTSRSRSSGSSRRGSPTCASTPARTARKCGSGSAHGERLVTVVDDGAGFDEDGIAPGPGPEEHAGAGRRRSAAAFGSSPRPDAEPRSRSCCGRRANTVYKPEYCDRKSI